MKTAVILFNSIDKNTHPATFLLICSDHAFIKGFTVIHTGSWREYVSMNMKDFVDRVYESVDAFFLFVDFGVSPLMLSVVESCYKHGSSDKEIHINIALQSREAGLGSILSEVAQVTRIPIDVLKSKTRLTEVVVARQFYFKRAKLFTNASLTRIGEMVKRDHATVLHGINLVNKCPSVRQQYEELFEGKKRERKQPQPITPEEVSKNDKAILIGRSTSESKIINMTSPFAGKETVNNRPYSGYRVHSL